jgi:hypothetical protein
MERQCDTHRRPRRLLIGQVSLFWWPQRRAGRHLHAPGRRCWPLRRRKPPNNVALGIGAGQQRRPRNRGWPTTSPSKSGLPNYVALGIGAGQQRRPQNRACPTTSPSESGLPNNVALRIGACPTTSPSKSDLPNNVALEIGPSPHDGQDPSQTRPIPVLRSHRARRRDQ